MLTTNELELRANLSLGTLESNAQQLKELVLSKLKDYSPELYAGKIAEAKADRAVLNNAEKQLNARRLELEREYMAPFAAFKGQIQDTCSAIREASGKLDEIVKAEEQREKDEKRAKIQEYWDSKDFTLFGLEQIFDSKWLNKGSKLKDVQAAIDERITKTFIDLSILEKFPAEDVPLLKTVYLETLDISVAMAKADALKANRDKLAREKVEREIAEQKAQLAEQHKEEMREGYKNHEADDAHYSAALALDIEPEIPTQPIEEYALILRGTRDQLLSIRSYMTLQGITYTKLVDKGDGVYSKEN